VYSSNKGEVCDELGKVEEFVCSINKGLRKLSSPLNSGSERSRRRAVVAVAAVVSKAAAVPGRGQYQSEKYFINSSSRCLPFRKAPL
jgi:hypothetical protein